MKLSELLNSLINDAHRNGKQDAFPALKLLSQPVAELEKALAIAIDERDAYKKWFEQERAKADELGDALQSSLDRQFALSRDVETEVQRTADAYTAQQYLQREIIRLKSQIEQLETEAEGAAIREKSLRDIISKMDAAKKGQDGELAYVTLQRDRLLEITWLDLPAEPHESTARWQEVFSDGWERKAVSDALRTRIAELEARVAASQQQWRPIETAPKDGTPFLGIEHPLGHGMCVIKWCRDHWHSTYSGVATGQEYPTHWMPLPTPPTE